MEPLADILKKPPTRKQPDSMASEDNSTQKPNVSDGPPLMPAKLKPAWKCPMCHDMGFTSPDNLMPEDEGFGVASPCPWCQRIENKQAQTFKNFEILGGMENAVRAAMDWCVGKITFLTLFGGWGTGKTHLAYASLGEMRKQGKVVEFVHTTVLLERLKEGFDRTKYVTFEDRSNEYMAPTALVIDDLGTERITDWTQEQMTKIINHRYQRGYPTMVTTNYGLEELAAKAGQSLASRVHDTGSGRVTVVTLEGPDYRTGKTW